MLFEIVECYENHLNCSWL